MSGFYKSGHYAQGWLGHVTAGGDDPAIARLRTAQMLRAVKAASALGGGPPPRIVGLSGQILDADDIGGDDARLIEGEPKDSGAP